MPVRTKKLIGMVALVGFILFYALLVMALGTSRLLDMGPVVTLLFYAAAGLLWVPPAGWIIRWMQRQGPRPVRGRAA